MIIAIALLFGGLLSLLYAAGKLASRTSSYDARLLVVAHIALALMLCHAAALLSGVLSTVPHLLGWYIPGLLLIGPVLLRLIHNRLGLSDRGRYRQWHLAPALLSIPALVFFLFVDTQSKLALIADIRGGSFEHPYILIAAATSLHPILYTLLGVLQLAGAVAWQLHRSEESVRLLGFILLSLGLISLVLFVGFLSRNQTLLSIGAMLSALAIPALYLIGQRYPDFLDELQVVVERGKYRISQLKGQDLMDIGRKLDALMKDQHLYQDENLSLAGLAERVQLTRHQLSEYFNVELKMNFSRYVNRHRVRAACELLVKKPELTVLNVAFEVGFNSKSVFNTAFSRETGLSPTTYRKNNVQSP